MFLHASSGLRGIVLDLDTNKPIPKPISLDEETGICVAYQVDEKGNELHEVRPDGLYFKTITYKGRFKFIPRGTPIFPDKNYSKLMGRPVCALCPSELTLMGDDLCVACRAHETSQKNKMKVERTDVFTRKACSHFGCGRLGKWCVSDEVEVSYQAKGLFLFPRGTTVGRRYYCDKHYTPPRLLDSKGEIIKDLNDEIRPE